MKHYVTTFLLPTFGKNVLFSIAVNEADEIVATAFGGLEDLIKRFTPGELVIDSQHTAAACAQVLAYAKGELTEFTVPLAPSGSAFQHRVWKALRRIEPGTTRSYGDLARELESSPRAVGRANATNPICLIVPCHRVIGADGSLTGFAFGEAIKRRLLDHEKRFTGRNTAPAHEQVATTDSTDARQRPLALA